MDEDTFLHTESDPRYRGAAIPSRAFRMLQNMTDGTADYSEQGMVAVCGMFGQVCDSVATQIPLTKPESRHGTNVTKIYKMQ